MSQNVCGIIINKGTWSSWWNER